MVQFTGAVRTQSLIQLSVYLCHRFPKVRKATADQLFTTLMTYSECVPEENTQSVMDLLSETEWYDYLKYIIFFLALFIFFFNFIFNSIYLYIFQIFFSNRDGNIENARVCRNTLCDLIHISKPMLIK